jgi:hypothetical protein
MGIVDMANDIVENGIAPRKLGIVFPLEEIINTLICFKKKCSNGFSGKINVMVQIREDMSRPKRTALVFFQFSARGTSVLLQSTSKIGSKVSFEIAMVV